MKIAVACKGQQICGNSGSFAEFAVYEVERGTILRVSRRICPEADMSAATKMLAQNDVDLLICGTVTSETAGALQDAGVLYIGGISGDVRTAVERYLAGTLPF